MNLSNLLKTILITLILPCIGLVGCKANGDSDGADDDQKISITDENIISVEAENSQDSLTVDPKSLMDEDVASPMPELDSVEDVLLTSDEEERVIDEAREKEKYEKEPRKPKPPPPE